MPSLVSRFFPAFTVRNANAVTFLYANSISFVGSRSEGGNAEYVVVKRANLFRLPSDMPIEDGAFIEPITVGLHAFHLAQGCEGKNVIIVGAGTIGLLALQCARELGARSVTAIDINPQKLELAKALGATHTCNSREMTADDIQTALSDIQFDQLVLETAGNSPDRLAGYRYRRAARATGAGGDVTSRSHPDNAYIRANFA